MQSLNQFLANNDYANVGKSLVHLEHLELRRNASSTLVSPNLSSTTDSPGLAAALSTLSMAVSSSLRRHDFFFGK